MISDSQFSSLGIVLVAQLAMIQTLVGGVGGREQKDSFTSLPPLDIRDSRLDGQAEDLGVAVGRDFYCGLLI